jgi:hypothetical protein
LLPTSPSPFKENNNNNNNALLLFYYTRFYEYSVVHIVSTPPKYNGPINVKPLVETSSKHDASQKWIGQKEQAREHAIAGSQEAKADGARHIIRDSRPWAGERGKLYLRHAPSAFCHIRRHAGSSL